MKKHTRYFITTIARYIANNLALISIIYIIAIAQNTGAQTPPDCITPNALGVMISFVPTGYTLLEDLVGGGTVTYDIPYGTTFRFEYVAYETYGGSTWAPTTHGYLNCTDNGYSWTSSYRDNNVWDSWSHVQEYLFPSSNTYSVNSSDLGWDNCSGTCLLTSVSGNNATISMIIRDQIDKCRQEYTDRNLSVPSRSSFVDSSTYVNPGHFSFSEMNGGDYPFMLMTIATHLENMRSRIGYSLIINSGYRNPVHNENVGGVSTSKHMWGRAADIRKTDITGDGIFDNTDYTLLYNQAAIEGTTDVIQYTNHVHIHWN